MSRHDREWAQAALAVERAVGTEVMGKACANWAHDYAARQGAVRFRAWYRPPILRLGRLIIRGRRRQVA